MGRPDEARKLDACAVVRRSKHHDLGSRPRDAGDGVDEVTLDKGPSLDLQPQGDEEPRRGIKVGDSDTDVVEASYMGHVVSFLLVAGRRTSLAAPHWGAAR